MATINFKGKNSVWNHHLSVPYQILEKDKKLSVKGKNEDENLVIEADNLIALKSLLPKYQGRIKCIYIDPPYNTGNESWVFNDKSNSPLIKDWIGKVVGKDDLTRHDKWLCMMTPRLKLLQELLDDDGIIFISIDDNEIARLRQLMDEIFIEKNFIGIICWHKKDNASFLSKEIVNLKEYFLMYKKSDSFQGTFDKKINKERHRELINISNKVQERVLPKESVNIENGKYSGVIKAGRYGSAQFNIEVLEDTKVISGLLQKDLRVRGRFSWSQKKIEQELESGGSIEIKTIKSFKPIFIRNYSDDDEIPYRPMIDLLTKKIDDRVCTNHDGTFELRELFNGILPFDYPKPSGIIKLLITSVCRLDKNAIILDSFAGSGTTAQAVLELNKEDGGNRKFILVQLPEKIGKDKPAYKAGFRYIHEITRERIKRVIKRDKLDVGFSYMKLGSQIDADSILAGKLPTYREFAKYVYYLAAGKTMDNEKSINEKDYFVGKINGETVYLIYEKDKEKLKNMAITLEWAEKINKKDSRKKIVYAPACFLDEEYLEKFNIDFVSIPYNLFEKK